MAELLKVAKAMFKSHKDWVKVTDVDKTECFFIFNRYLSKKYPEKSNLLNDKLMDKILGMDLWFHFMKTQPYPDYFWSKSEKDKDKSGYTDKEINELIFKLDITKLELDLLIKFYPDLIKDELKYYKDAAKGNK